MLEWWVCWILGFILITAALAGFFAVIYDLWMAFGYEFREGVACALALMVALASYVLARTMGFSLALSRQDSSRETLRDPFLWFVALLAGWCGYEVARQLRGHDHASFRRVLFALGWTLPIVVELAVAMVRFGGEPRALVFGSTFVIALGVVVVTQIPKRRRAALVDPSADAGPSGGYTGWQPDRENEEGAEDDPF